MKVGYPELFLLFAGVISFQSLTWGLSLAGGSAVIAFVRLALQIQEKKEKQQEVESTAKLLNEQAEELGQALSKLFNATKKEVLNNLRKSLKTLDNDSKTPGNIELGPAPYFTGWIQYFKFSSNKSNLKKPTTFFKNMQFFEQKKLSFGQTPVPDFTKKDADGQYILIPNPTHFYVTMFERSLNIANSKEVSYNNF